MSLAFGAVCPLKQLSAEKMIRALGTFMGLGRQRRVQSLPSRGFRKGCAEPEVEGPPQEYCSESPRYLVIVRCPGVVFTPTYLPVRAKASLEELQIISRVFIYSHK